MSETIKVITSKIENYGDCVLYKENKKLDTWYFRIWDKTNKRYIKRNTRTSDLKTAKIFTKKMYKEYFFNRNTPLTYHQLVEKYREEKKTTIKTSSLYVLSSHLNRMLNHIGRDKLIISFDHNFKNYSNKRIRISKSTIVHETNTIKSFYAWSIRNGYMGRDVKPIFDERIQTEEGKEYFTLGEYRTFVKYIRRWDKKTDVQKEKDLRIFVKTFCLVLSHTGMSPKECRNLKWKDFEYSPIGRVHILRVPNRVVSVYKGDMLRKLKTLSVHTKPDDYIFVDNETGERITETTYRRLWSLIEKETGLSEMYKRTYKTLRYTFAYFRLNAEGDMDDIHRSSGLSKKVIYPIMKTLRNNKKYFLSHWSREQYDNMLKT
jgi:integrase